MPVFSKCVYNEKTKELNSGGAPFPCPVGGLGKGLFDKMKKYADDDLIAQVDGETSEEESYKTFLNKCIKLALYMIQQGIQKGDIISICSDNTMNNSAVFLASLFIGAINASTDPRFSVIEAKYLLGVVEPRMIFASEDTINLIKGAVEGENYKCKLIALYKDDTLENIPEILNQFTDKETEIYEPIFVNDTSSTACMMFSSGTTGLHKAARISHDALCADFDAIFHNSLPYIIPQMRITGYATLFSLCGVYFTLAPFFCGHIKVNIQEYQPETMWDLIDKLKVNLIYLPYSQAMDSLPHLTHSLPHLKCLGIISGQIAAIYYKEYKNKLPNTHIVYGYGMTEVGFATVQYGDCVVESSGKPVPKDVIFKIVDPDTETALDLNIVGEIRIKNKTAMCGYYKNTTIDVWDNQGFLKTGDLGYFNEKYELFIVDRIKEMFRFNGRHTIPARIERILREHHAVLHATIIGIPINDNDHHAMGIVVLRDGYSVSADELINLVNDRMDVMHQIRAGIQFLADNEIPYTVTGKIDRRKLKQMYSN